MQTFKQSTLHYAFLRDGRLGIGPYRDELWLHRASQSSDPLQMANVVTILTLGFSYTSKILQLEGEKVFGFVKWKKKLPLGLEGDSHRHDHVKLFCPQVKFTLHNSTPNGDVRQSNVHKRASQFSFIMARRCWNALYGDDVWHIEWCNPKSNAQCSALQKDTKHYCKAKIILRGTKWGILVPCYVGNWSVAKGATIELHKFWFCHDIRVVVLEALGENMQLEGLWCLLYGLCRKEHISPKMRWWHWKKLVFSYSRNQNVTP